MRDKRKYFPLTSFILFLFIHSFFYPGEAHRIPTSPISANQLWDPIIIPLSLEHAVAKEELSWGFMQRSKIADNHGMTFNFQTSKKRSFWSFNCLIDLSIAYLDENKMIREIHDIPAYPEMMDPNRPVKKLSDLSKYPQKDPTATFFLNHASPASFPLKYAIETRQNWFQENHVKAGDLAYWEIDQPMGYISRSIDLKDLNAKNIEFLALSFSQPCIYSLKIPKTFKKYHAVYLDDSFKIIKIDPLGGKECRFLKNAFFSISEDSTKYVLFAPQKWVEENRVHQGDFLFLNP